MQTNTSLHIKFRKEDSEGNVSWKIIDSISDPEWGEYLGLFIDESVQSTLGAGDAVYQYIKDIKPQLKDGQSIYEYYLPVANELHTIVHKSSLKGKPYKWTCITYTKNITSEVHALITNDEVYLITGEGSTVQKIN
jgi:hypothetical protein